MRTAMLPAKSRFRRLTLGLVTLTASLGIAVLGVVVAPWANADDIHKIEGCGESSPLIHSIEVVSDQTVGEKIVVTPTNLARAMYGIGPQQDPVTWAMWHTVQGCVSGLYGHVADTVYQQLECHRMYGLVPANGIGTGPTYDLEVSQPALVDPNPYSYVRSHCLNNDWGQRVS